MGAATRSVKAVVLVEDDGLSLYRRWDPYTSVPIPVLQVTAETGRLLFSALINGTASTATSDRCVASALYLPPAAFDHLPAGAATRARSFVRSDDVLP